MERNKLEHLVDDLFERTDARLFAILHKIADLALSDIEKGESPQRIPPNSVSILGGNIDASEVAPSSVLYQETPIT